MEGNHFNQIPKRDAEYITPPNTLKNKVGSGGLSEAILDRAQALLENNTQDFQPLAEIYLERMDNAIKVAMDSKNMDKENIESLIAHIVYPSVQLKANGGMFHYPLVTRIAHIFVQFMEVVERLDAETLEIAQAFYTSIRIVVNGQIKNDGGQMGNALVQELNSACERYFEKHKEQLDLQNRGS